MKKKLLVVLLSAAMCASLFGGCASQVGEAPAETTEETTEENAVNTEEMTEEELQAAWEKEPAYGTTLQVGYNGGACLGGFGIALARVSTRSRDLMLKS